MYQILSSGAGETGSQGKGVIPPGVQGWKMNAWAAELARMRDARLQGPTPRQHYEPAAAVRRETEHFL